MKTLLLTFVALVGIVFFWACHNNDDVYQDDQSEKEQIYLGVFAGAALSCVIWPPY